jgi:hypothetical protein
MEPIRMASNVSNAQQLRLHGPPRCLRLTSTAIPKSGIGTLTLSATGGRGEAMSVPAHILSRRDEAGELTVKLPESTAPGIYSAQLEIAGEQHPVELNVEAEERLIVGPGELEFEGEPGAAAEIKSTLSNRGNVSIVIPTAFTCSISDDDALEEAFTSTYRQETDDALKLFSHWIGKLREGDGGTLKCNVVAGGDALAPGEQRAVTIKTTLPSKLKPGHVYHGELELGPLVRLIGVKVNKRERGGRK